MLYSYKHSCGVTVKVYYVQTVEDTVNLNNLNLCISDVYENNYRYDGNLFKNSTIEVWDPAMEGTPVNMDTYVNGVFKSRTGGIGNYGGLTYGDGLIQLNSSTIKTFDEMAQCFSHEWGHLKAYIMGFYNEQSAFKKQWTMQRSYHSTEATPPVELVAEDLRFTGGCRGAKNVARTDRFNYPQANTVKGLKDLYRIWKPAEEVIASYNTIYSKPYSINFKYSDNDFDYISVSFAVASFLPWCNTFITVDRNGVSSTTNGVTKVLKRF